MRALASDSMSRLEAARSATWRPIDSPCPALRPTSWARAPTACPSFRTTGSTRFEANPACPEAHRAW